MDKKQLLIILVTATVVLLILYTIVLRPNDEKNMGYFTDLEFFNETNMFENDRKIFGLNLNYLINSNICEHSDDFLAVILVTSYFGNIETRSAMRRSFSSEKLKKLGLRRVFLLGLAPEDKFTSQQSVTSEAARFGDIVQGNFIEAYRNLTYKHVMGLTWALEFCKNATYIVKMDDDIVFDVIGFVDLLRSIKMPKFAIGGYVFREMVPIREPYNKWYVKKEEFSESKYPPFVSGWLYVTTPGAVERLLITLEIMKMKYFWIDDVFVTGVLVRKSKVKHFDLSKYFAVHSEYIECCTDGVLKHRLRCDFLIGPNGGDNNLFYKFNEVLKVCRENVCSNRNSSIEKTCVTEKKVHLSKGNAVVSSYKLH